MYPEATVVAFIALVPVSAFVAFVAIRRQLPAFVALIGSLVLLSYAYFGGLTPEGRVTFSFGPLLGLVALGFVHRASRSRGGTAPY